MPTRASQSDGRTRIERERRTQIIDATITLVAERGYAEASLSQIARAAGVAKGTVVYHFSTKDAVLAAAYQQVLTALVTHVAGQVEAAPAQLAPGAYVRAMIGHLTEHPEQARTIVQAGVAAAAEGDRPRPTGQERWAALAEILGAAARADGRSTDTGELRTLAILAGGMIDAVVEEFLEDPSYDANAAAETIVRLLTEASGS
ncbi:TetR/AcrR family transcriptional regulator [Dietzia sp. PP-33]|uniref:TetR/AcrR family transcriptional regulator n=1 Tax=Dietzia sp. PP-33 TaxID=2957500 RepID=UPI0029BC37FE|nr:TetR/AcrR family transcriptional regulator [Dietzia sp. PP-33]MDX2358755.1 TetR/AcrR family transcriptional regulator [Dietzia sp. PP-33]